MYTNEKKSIKSKGHKVASFQKDSFNFEIYMPIASSQHAKILTKTILGIPVELVCNPEEFHFILSAIARSMSFSSFCNIKDGDTLFLNNMLTLVASKTNSSTSNRKLKTTVVTRKDV